MILKVLLLALAMAFLGAGCVTKRSQGYADFYSYLKPSLKATPMATSDYFLVVLVEARHLDYTDNRGFIKSMAKHPSDGSKNGDVGHAWIYLQGRMNGQSVFLEGGHSGELGIVQARYFDGLMNNIEYGCANPTEEQRLCPQDEPNPVKYLWEAQKDGYFEWGSGRHYPTFAAKVDLSPQQFQRIFDFIQNYPFDRYSITGNQCSSFAAQVASLGGLEVECEVTMPIDQYLEVGEDCFCLWQDPSYSLLTISSPDVLERSLMQAVREGRAQCALDWYRQTHPKGISKKHRLLQGITLLPLRCARLKAL